MLLLSNQKLSHDESIPGFEERLSCFRFDTTAKYPHEITSEDIGNNLVTTRDDFLLEKLLEADNVGTWFANGRRRFYQNNNQLLPSSPHGKESTQEWLAFSSPLTQLLKEKCTYATVKNHRIVGKKDLLRVLHEKYNGTDMTLRDVRNRMLSSHPRFSHKDILVQKSVALQIPRPIRGYSKDSKYLQWKLTFYQTFFTQ